MITPDAYMLYLPSVSLGEVRDLPSVSGGSYSLIKQSGPGVEITIV